MTLRSVMLQLSEDQIDELDRIGKQRRVSRSSLVRDAVDELLSPASDLTVDAQYAAAYPTPTFGTDLWGDLDAWHGAAKAHRTHRTLGDAVDIAPMDEPW